MPKIPKKELYDYISNKHKMKYSDPKGYDEFKAALTLLKLGRQDDIDDMHDLVDMNNKERLLYRYRLSTEGTELTPKQVDIHISIIEYALKYVNENT